MRIIIVTQNEHLYLPVMLNNIFSGWRKGDFTGIVILEGETSSKNLRKYSKILTLREILSFSFLLLKNKLMEVLDRITRHRMMNQHSLESVATVYNVPIYRTADINSKEFMKTLEMLKIDLIISIAAPQIFREQLLNLPRLGCINVHCSPLPKYRGLLPSFWVLARNEKETGVTIHYMNQDLDDGDIILQEGVPVYAEDTFHSLVSRIKSNVAPRLLIRALKFIEKDTVTRIQNDKKLASCFSFPKKEDVRQFRENGRRFC